jgi:hypothetical protein
MGRGIACLLLAFALVRAADADESPVNVSVVETKDLKLYYYNYLGFLVPHTVRTFTNSLEWQRHTFGWVPSEPVRLLLEDFTDFGGAGAAAAPHSFLTIDVAPPNRAFETFAVSERMYSLANHELVHVVQTDMASDQERRWRDFFHGKVAPRSDNPETLLYSYLTIPRYDAPRWYSEGGAVFMETWMAGGLGRAQGGYDEMVFRAMVRDDATFYDPLGLVARGFKVDFQGPVNAYLYGTRFFTWLAYTYSPEKLIEWIRRNEGSERYYSDQFQKVFGIPLEQAWQEWVAFEHEFQWQNLAEVRKFPVTAYHQLAARAIGSVSRMYYDESTGILYAAFRSPDVIDNVGALNTRDGSIRRLADLNGAVSYKVASLAYDPGSGTLFYTNHQPDLRDLMSVNVKTGEVRTLLKEARIGEIAFNPADRSLMGVRHEDGLATLVRIPYPYTDWKEIHTFPWENVLTDLDISPDGRLLSASMNDDQGNQYLRVWQLEKILAGDVSPLRECIFGQSVPENFVFSQDGRYLYGSSYYTGVSNIFRCDIATGKIEAVSNAETGFFRPVPLADGRLVVLTYTASGFVPAIIEPRPLEDVSAIKFFGSEVAEKYPIVKTWQVAAPNTVDNEKLITGKGPYIPLRSVELVNAYPVLQGYKTSKGVGYRFNFEDPLQFASLNITAAYTPDSSLPSDQRGHVVIDGHYRSWFGGFAWNRSDFYDLFGPVRRGRKGYATNLGTKWSLISDEPRKLDLRVTAAYYDQIDTMPDAQNVPTNFTRLVTEKVELRYSDVWRSRGAVDDEKGLSGSLLFQGNQVQGQTTPQLRGNIDYGIALPIPHSSLWFRTAAGIADGAHNQTVANFYFGGFGNNYVDDGPVARYRDYDKFPGFGIDQISALRFARELVEWNSPPVILPSLGTPAGYLSWGRGSLFAAGLWTEPGNSPAKNYGSFGGQIDLGLGVLHRYDMTLSVGYAVGYQGSQRSGSEWMVSLKVM